MDFKKLKGLTIQDVIVEHHTVYDDDPSIVLWMDNGRKYRIEGGAEEGTDESSSEWRGKLTLSSVNVKREPEFRVNRLEIPDWNNKKQEIALMLNGLTIEHFRDVLDLVNIHCIKRIESLIK